MLLCSYSLSFLIYNTYYVNHCDNKPFPSNVRHFVWVHFFPFAKQDIRKNGHIWKSIYANDIKLNTIVQWWIENPIVFFWLVYPRHDVTMTPGPKVPKNINMLRSWVEIEVRWWNLYQRCFMLLSFDWWKHFEIGLIMTSHDPRNPNLPKTVYAHRTR